VKIPLPPEGFGLECGQTLPEVVVAYETYGTLLPDRSNVIFICHALSGDAHVAGRLDRPDGPVGWWDEMVGPGKGIDTNLYHVICANILGGCRGTTGPASLNPATGKPYGSLFPKIGVGDIVNVHLLFLKEIGVERVAAIVGGSFGGMQVLDWAIRHPATAERCVCIASSASLSAQALAFDVVGRRAIMYDPDWQDGDFYGSSRGPARGLSLARKIGHITYLSPEMMTEKFGRERRMPAAPDAPAPERFYSTFQVESYLNYQGRKFVERFDANSYLHITEAMDEYDLEEQFGSLTQAFEGLRCKMLVVALSSDWLFPPEQSMEIANALLRDGKDVSYCLLHSPHGHDAFLVNIRHLTEVLQAFLPWVGAAASRPENRRAKGGEADSDRTREHRVEFEVISEMMRPDSRVLDLGCGGGELLSMLRGRCRAQGLGVDIDIRHVIEVIDRGHNIFQGDIDAGLAMIPDGAYDYAVVSETLQVVRKPLLVLREILRVAREGIVSFPNFAKWSHRVHLGLKGRMPVGRTLPYEWYDTPNIHLFTLKDFVALCRKEGIRVVDVVCIPGGSFGAMLIRAGLCNLGADRVLVKIAKGGAPGGEGADGTIRCRMPALARMRPLQGE
jgi:homoserine O-acetyltransferase